MRCYDDAGAGVRERRAPSLYVAMAPCQLLFITVFRPYLSAGERGRLFYCSPGNGSGYVILLPISCRYKLSHAALNPFLLLHVIRVDSTPIPYSYSSNTTQENYLISHLFNRRSMEA